MIKNNYEVILQTPMGENDADAATIGHYLYSLLWNLWDEGEGFSGKRPFGNSSWEYDLYKPLVEGGHVEGRLDSEGYLDYVNKDQADKLVFELIDFIFEKYCG